MHALLHANAAANAGAADGGVLAVMLTVHDQFLKALNDFVAIVPRAEHCMPVRPQDGRRRASGD